MKRLGLIIILCLISCMIGFSSAQAEITGPHKIPHIKGVCANCHIPHKAKGNRIWARELLEGFGGVRQLCNSCHDGTFSESIRPSDPNASDVESGILTVFGSRYESHVMHEEANITPDVWLSTYDDESFPLDPNDSDSVSGHPDTWDKGGTGFYCGSCHNPHIQLEENGDYLRTKIGADIGVPGNRSLFCKQCHDPVETGNSHLTNDYCQTCHHPHKGYKKAKTGMSINELKIARLIFKSEVVITARFIAEPNIPELTEDPNDQAFISSSFCYGCHQARHILGTTDPNNNFWREAGAAPIYGDEINGISNDTQTNRRNHHPMGTQARLQGGTFIRAPGTESTNHLNNNGELTCISCHADLHGLIDGKNYDQSKDNNFLRWDFTNDNAEFCIKCHSDKIMGNNQIIYDSKHFWDTNSQTTPVTREVFSLTATNNNYEKTIPSKQCMFCHFIHDGEERNNEGTPGAIRADIDALMRIGPINLAWGDRSGDSDLNDYEDMCYGCHGAESIVNRPDLNLDALLKPDSFFTHRFASQPDPNSPTSAKIEPGGVYPLSDGPSLTTPNDYGTETGRIFCGSCHNVHNGRIKPYLNHAEGDINLALDNGFCEACHDDVAGEFIHMSHPVNDPDNAKPNPPATVSSWNPIYYQGGSGKPFGITGNGGGAQGTVICLTCHNVHACTTSYDGRILQGDDDKTHGFLLIKDNKSTPEGSDMCQDCHQF